MKLELQTGYIADSIIDVKLKRFGEKFASIEEVLIIKKLMELRLKKQGLEVEFIDRFFSNYFRVDNGVITKFEESNTLKAYLSDKEIKEIIYDNNFIYYCLCQILINKLNNSIEHKCNNCITECTGLFQQPHSRSNDCTRWTHDFIEDCINNISTSERLLIAENPKQQGFVKKLKKDDEHMRRLGQIIKKDFEEDE